MKVWLPCTHRVSPPARAESQIEPAKKDSVASDSQQKLLWWKPVWPCAVCRHTPGRRRYPSAATTCYTMEVSTIPGESHPGLGSAGSINAVPSAGRARHTQPWPRYSSAQASRATLAPSRYAKLRPIFQMPDPPPGDACGLAPRHTDRGSTIFRPVCKLPTIMRPRGARPIPPRKSRSLPYEPGARQKDRPLNRRHPTQRGNHRA